MPDRADIIWLDFDPQVGREQAGRRPALVISSIIYNRIGLALVCPITSKVKGYPFEVALPVSGKISGVVLADALKNVDWRGRNADFIAKAVPAVIIEVQEKLRTLVL
ncbi:MAG: type II toxin-antitoxin system PemK/MazF family toxin [Anaerolineae bacterium]|nr:type II toxin-antitoxin system PemK/MazF family toxin [Gloeobacterales cyanobacterium ES-bin-313]